MRGKTKTCLECKYSVQRKEPEAFECRESSPQIVQGKKHGQFPIVLADFACGRYRYFKL